MYETTEIWDCKESDYLPWVNELLLRIFWMDIKLPALAKSRKLTTTGIKLTSQTYSLDTPNSQKPPIPSYLLE